MTYYSFELQYFSKTVVSDIDNLEHLSGSLVLFAIEIDSDTSASTVVFSGDVALESDSSYNLVHTFVILDKAYTFSMNFNQEYGLSHNFDYPNSLFVDKSVFSAFPVLFNTGGVTTGDGSAGDGSSFSGFSVPSLNGNCGSLPDGSVVTVTGLSGEFNVVASQFVWNDSTAQMSMIMYNLSKDGKFCLVPDVYVTAKAS